MITTKKEILELIKEALTVNLNLQGKNLDQEEVIFHYLNKERCFDQDKIYGLGNNITEIFERIFEIERIINSEEESLDFEMSMGLNNCLLLIRDILKEHGKGI